MLTIYEKLMTGENVKAVPCKGTVLFAVQYMAKHIDREHELVLVSDKYGEICRVGLVAGLGPEVRMATDMFGRCIIGERERTRRKTIKAVRRELSEEE